MKRIVTYGTEETYHDRETGEISTTVTTKSFKSEKEPSFVKLYLDDIAKLYSLPKGSNNVLYEFAKRMGYDGLIVVNASVKRAIAAEIGSSVSHISNSITRFIVADVMKRKDTGVFILNPDLIAKGFWKDVQKTKDTYIDLHIIYSKTGKRITVGVL